MSSRALRYRPPEEIPFPEYDQHRDAFAQLMDSHWKRNEAWITEEAEKLGYLWVIVVGKDIVGGGTNIRNFPDQDVLDDIGRSIGLVAFAYVLDYPPTS